MGSPNGSVKSYDENGVLILDADYVAGKTTKLIYYYPNGNKKAFITYSDDKQNVVKGWDENGKEIKDYIFEKVAKFPGGPQGWVKFLTKNLRTNTAADAGAKP